MCGVARSTCLLSVSLGYGFGREGTPYRDGSRIHPGHLGTRLAQERLGGVGPLPPGWAELSAGRRLPSVGTIGVDTQHNRTITVGADIRQWRGPPST
ncbi:hypothetical protein GCM10029963_45940 [Micromonospora andamanensis]